MAKKESKMAKKESTAVVEKPETTPVIYESDTVPDYIKAGQRGSENVSTDDIIIPRLELIQGLSPYVKDGDPKFNPDARPGMLINSVTGQLYGKEVMLVPVYFMKQWLVWRKRKWVDEKGREQTSEGGFMGSYNTQAEAHEEATRREAEGGAPIEIIDTPQHLCLLINFNAGSIDEVMVSMPRTKAKVSRQWNSMVRLAGGDRFSRAYRVTSALEKNSRGDYYNFVIAQSGFPRKDIYERAEKLYEQISSGDRTVVVDVSGLDPAETEYLGGDSSEM